MYVPTFLLLVRKLYLGGFLFGTPTNGLIPGWPGENCGAILKYLSVLYLIIMDVSFNA